MRDVNVDRNGRIYFLRRTPKIGKVVTNATGLSPDPRNSQSFVFIKLLVFILPFCVAARNRDALVVTDASYRRRNPEESLLYQVVADELEGSTGLAARIQHSF